VRDFLVGAILLGGGGRIATADDGDRARRGGLDDRVGHGLGAGFEFLELENACRAIPDDGSGLEDRFGEDLRRLGTAVEPEPAVGNPVHVVGTTGVGSRVELVGDDEVYRQQNLLALFPRFLHQTGHELGALFVEQRIADRHARENLLEGEGHAAANDDLVGLVEEIVDQLNLVSDLGTPQNGQQWALRRLENGRERCQFLVHQITRRTLGQLNAGHRRVVTVSGAESIVDVDVGEPGQRRPEGLHVVRAGLDLGDAAVRIGHAGLAFFFDMETEILEEDHLARLDLRTGGLDFRADAIGKELHRSPEQPLEGGRHRGKTVLRHYLPVGPAEVRHQDHGGALFQSRLDCRQRGLDTLGVGDGAGHLVLRDVEINANQGALAFEGEIFDEQFGHDFLDSEMVLKKAGIRMENGMVPPYWPQNDSSSEHLEPLR
jgi:hypothetical protein